MKRRCIDTRFAVNCVSPDDKSFDLHILRGDVALAMRDRAQALESYRRAGQLRPESDIFRSCLVDG